MYTRKNSFLGIKVSCYASLHSNTHEYPQVKCYMQKAKPRGRLHYRQTIPTFYEYLTLVLSLHIVWHDLSFVFKI